MATRTHECISVEQIKSIYNRAYSYPGLMGTHFDLEYSRATKTTLLSLCSEAPNPYLLDLGTGDGDLWQFASETKSWHGIDISEVGVRRAVRRFPALRGVVGTVENLPYLNGFFGAVIAVDVLEHTLDLDQCLSEVRRVLAPDGVFAFSVPPPHQLRRWGYLRMARNLRSVSAVLRLLQVLAKRVALFGQVDFQPIWRHMSLDEWLFRISEAGFRVMVCEEWPPSTEEPMTYLLSAV